jgi:hypothetical protein
MNNSNKSTDGIRDEVEEAAAEPYHQNRVVDQQADIVVLLPRLPKEDKAVSNYHTDQNDPRRNGSDHRTLQEVYTEETSHSEQKQSLPKIVQPFLGLLCPLDQSQDLEQIVRLDEEKTTMNM